MNRLSGSDLVAALVCFCRDLPLLKNHVYTQKTGLIRGLKRRGGFGFWSFNRALSREQAFLQSLDYRGKTVYDIGGHIGLVSLFFARQVGKAGHVVTFEPNPQNVRAILDHVRLNGLANVRVMPIGLGDRCGALAFVVPAFASARGTAEPSKQAKYLEKRGARLLEIRIDTLDHQVAANSLPKPDFIKVDVEGYELHVLHGMAETIARCRPAILVELHNVHEHQVAEFFLSHRYAVRQVEDDIQITWQNIERVHGHLYACDPQDAGAVGVTGQV